MSYRTDLEYQGGKLAVRDNGNSADTRQPLPEVKGTDNLASDKWGDSLKSQAGKMADDPALNAAAMAHRKMVDGFRSLVEQRNTQDPATTQLQHLRQVERNYRGLIDNAAKQSDSSRTQIRERISKVKSEFESSLKFTNKDAAEIRAMVRKMPENKRSEFISQAIEAGDGQILGAVFDSHPSLSGITAERAAGLYKQAMHRHNPDALKLMGALEKADRLLFDSFNDLLMTDEAITAKGIREKHEAAAMKAKEAADKAKSDPWQA
ncbi:MAG: hypothetical protein ACX933_05570 [Marinobacter adhaerens]